jgi:PKD repeat protein
MGMALTYDPTDGYVLAYGGGGFFVSCGSTRATACNSTWTFHGGKWQVLPSAGASPPVSMQLGMVYDAADGYVVASDGFTTWKFSADTWTDLCGITGNCSNPIPHPPRFAGVMAYDSQAGEVLYFGDASTWKFSGGNWTNITSTSGTPPPSAQYAMMTDDPATGSVLYFGGCGAGCNSVGWTQLNYTWSFSGGTWSNITTVVSPPGRYAGALAYDPGDSVVVLFGGDTQLGAGGNLNDTWVWGSSPPIGELNPSVTPSTPLPGSTATFSVSFKGGVGPFAFSWRFGDGNSSVVATPTHDFAKVGFYRVSLWVNDSAGHTANTSFQVHVYVPLSVELNVSPNPAALGMPVNFTAVATGGMAPYTFAWTFGDGGTGGNLSNITHIFTTNGPFTTVVTVRDSVRGVAHGYLNISIRLQALAAASASSGASPLTVSFVGEGQGGSPPYVYSWAFGDGVTSTAQDPRHTYNLTGLFDVVLTVTDSRQNHSVTSLVIRVGSGSTTSSGSSSWFYEFVGAAVLAGAVGGAWAAVVTRQRKRRREGEEWVKELTSDGEGSGARVPPPK